MKQDLDFEFPEDFNQNEITELMDDLERYITPVPPQDEINMTIENLRQFVPQKKANIKYKKLYELFKRATEEISFMSSTYWLVSLGIFIIGLYIIWSHKGYFNEGYNTYTVSILLAPIPFIFGIMEVFRGREEGVIELELSCKISISEIILSRLIIICIYNILLNTLLSIILVYFNSTIIFWKITFMWLTPFTLVSSLGLFCASKIRGSYIVTIFTSVWLIMIISIVSLEKLMDRIMGFNILAYVVLSLIGIILIGLQIKEYGQRYFGFYEGSVMYEAKN